MAGLFGGLIGGPIASLVDYSASPYESVSTNSTTGVTNPNSKNEVSGIRNIGKRFPNP